VKVEKDSSVHFRRVGDLVGSLHFAHVGFDVDLGALVNQLQ
jgi:hypothetical protein